MLPHDRRYFLSTIFGALLVALSDPGGKYGPRVAKMAAMAGAGALLTALAFGIGASAWGRVVLAGLKLPDADWMAIAAIIAIIVLLLAGLLQKRTAKPATQTPPAPQTPQASTT